MDNLDLNFELTEEEIAELMRDLPRLMQEFGCDVSKEKQHGRHH